MINGAIAYAKTLYPSKDNPEEILIKFCSAMPTFTNLFGKSERILSKTGEPKSAVTKNIFSSELICSQTLPNKASRIANVFFMWQLQEFDQ